VSSPSGLAIRKSKISAYFGAHLSPGERLGEILCGLIMTLTFTLGASLLQSGSNNVSGARALLYATLGCNVAWAIIDSTLLIFARMFERSRLMRIGDSIRRASANEDLLPIIARELDALLGTLAEQPAREALYREVVRHIRALPSHPVRLTRADAYAAAATFLSVFVATLPALVPYFVIANPQIALRTSNALQIAVLFWVGYHWAGYTRLDPWLAGAAVTLLGIALVAVAMALGG
jgi:hypothetical protein